GADVLPEGWPDAWIRLTNPQVFPASGDEWRTVARAIEAIHRAFVRKYPDARSDDEIDRHLSSMFIRVAQWGAARRRLGSAWCFLRAARLNFRLALGALPRYVGHWVLRRRGSSGRLIAAPAPRPKGR